MAELAGDQLRAHLLRLLEVQAMDRRHDALEAELRRVREGAAVAVARAELAAAEDAHRAKQAALAEAKKRVRWGEGEAREIDGQVAGFEKQLYGGRIGNPKELEALSAKIGELRRRREGIDEETLAAMEEADGLESEVAALQERVRQGREAVERLLAGQQADAGRLAAQLAEIPPLRAPLVAQVEPALLREYEGIRARRGGIGIAAVRDGVCEACRVTLPILVARVLQGGAKTRCENCGRLLVWGGG